MIFIILVNKTVPMNLFSQSPYYLFFTNLSFRWLPQWVAKESRQSVIFSLFVIFILIVTRIENDNKFITYYNGIVVFQSTLIPIPIQSYIESCFLGRSVQFE